MKQVFRLVALAALAVAANAAHAQNADSTAFSGAGGVPTISGLWDANKAAAALTAGFAVPGPQGPKGDTGATGATGPMGPQGPAGADGGGDFTVSSWYGGTGSGVYYNGICSANPNLASGLNSNLVNTGYVFGKPGVGLTDWAGGDTYIPVCPSNLPYFYPLVEVGEDNGATGGGT